MAINAETKTIFATARRNFLAERRSLEADRELFATNCDDAGNLSKDFARAYDAGVVSVILDLTMTQALATLDKPVKECSDSETKARQNARKRRSDRVKAFGIGAAHPQGGKEAQPAESDVPEGAASDREASEPSGPTAPARGTGAKMLDAPEKWAAFVQNIGAAIEAAVAANLTALEDPAIAEAVGIMRDAVNEAQETLIPH